MRQNQKYPIFTVNPDPYKKSLGFFLLAIAMWMFSAGCRERTTVEIPRAILQAKDATLEELLEIVNRCDEITTLVSADIAVEYVSQKQESGIIELEKYPKSDGYILLKRPDSIYFVVQAPVVKNRILTLVSVGDEFRVLYHRDQVFYIGRNSARELISEELEDNPKIPIRAAHILEAVFPQTIPLEDPNILVSRIEEQDSNAKYYILEVYRDNISRRLQPLRKFWIERAGLTISRQRIYGVNGQIIGDISYSDTEKYEKYTMPGKIHIERPLEGYILDLEIREWSINSSIKDGTFELEPPAGARVIRFQ